MRVLGGAGADGFPSPVGIAGADPGSTPRLALALPSGRPAQQASTEAGILAKMGGAEDNRDLLIERISREEARLARIELTRSDSEKRLLALRRQLDSEDRPAAQQGVPHPPRSSAEKVELFRTLFRGRADVFPTHWRNLRKQTSGYSPACSNEWVSGICEKPRIKCGECPNQAFMPVTYEVVLDHLQGRHVAGVYPLLEDETCWFLAVDFDKADWQADVRAFRQTCERFGLHAAVERSRSGDGAHVWFFFSQPVPAIDARRMGSYLLTETMTRRHELPLTSYDRLFPNQDTMPRGGFGNLIALPLQYAGRQQGNTVFVNADWIAFADQWAYLASIPRLAPAVVEKLAREASDLGRAGPRPAHVLRARDTRECARSYAASRSPA